MSIARLLTSAAVCLALSSTLAQASPLSDAKAGMDALGKGDNATAIQRFTSAIASGGLAKPDLELAYVKRAQAHLAAGEKAAALADATSALGIDPNDAEAQDVKIKASPVGGPSLEETLAFITNLLQKSYPINVTVLAHNTSSGLEVSNTLKYHIDNIEYVSSKCILKGNFILYWGDNVVKSNNWSVLFSKIYNVYRSNYIDNLNEVDAISGHPEIIVTGENPNIYGVTYAYDDGGKINFYFYDEDTANRFAKAVRHAADLCGGGKSTSPF